MLFKKCQIMIFMTCFFLIFGFAKERPKSISLKELQNVKGPSYVPFPYPKDQNEIIADLVYYLNRSKQRTSTSFVKSSDNYGKTWGCPFLAYLMESKDPYLKIRQIMIIKNKIYYAPEERHILIEFERKNQILCRYMLKDNGLFSGCNWGFEDRSLDPFPTDDEVRELLKKNHLLVGLQVNSGLPIYRVAYEGLLNCDIGYPYAYAELQNRSFFISNEKSIYELTNTIDVKNKNEMVRDFYKINGMNFPMTKRNQKYLKLYLYDSIDEKMLELVNLNQSEAGDA